ncbi:MAG: secretin N-terminal domain-containing protein [Verrucomicrobiota bacterium]|nr:secretin N-terminal domain-containing protein [Verrucomicrobiota bacterium]
MLRFISIISLSALLILTSHGYAQDTDGSRARVLTSPTALPKGMITPAEPELEEPEAIVGEIMLVDDTANQVLVLLEQLTGKIILRRQDLPVSKFNFNSRGAMTKREAVLALESLLTLNGIMLTDMGGRFMKAVPATNVNSQVPIMLAGSSLELDASQQIYAKLFKLDYLNAVEAGAPLVQNLVSQNSSVLPFPKSNALLITDALVNIQRIETIFKDADRAQVIREEIKFIKLDFVQAVEMQERIENLIQGPLKSYLEGNTSVTADERTNQLILITHPGNLAIIMDVIQSVDVDAAPLTASEVFQLRQAKAEEVVPIIEDIISGQKEGREEDAQVARENERTINANNRGNNNAPAVEVNAPASSVGVIEANSSLQFSNFVGLAADERTNAIVAYGTQQDLKTLKELIEKIDIPLPQVLIEAIITQVTLNEKQTSGLESFKFVYEGATRTFTDIATGTAGGITFSGGTISMDNPSGFSLTTDITPTNTDSDTRVLSAPRIVVSHNEEGIINVSRSQPIITASTTSGVSSTLNTRSAVEYRDIGIKLTVTPLIGADGTVQMVIEQTVENVIENISIDGNDQPIIGVREATSTISVKDREIIVLGGLQENTNTDSNNYFPIFGRLPIIRSILGASTDDYERTEIIIFIRPTVLHRPEEAEVLAEAYIENASEEEVIKTYLEEDTTGDIYLEGSKFEEKEAKETKKRTWPRLFRR